MGPISHQEMLAWAQLMRVDITPSEVDALRRIDTEYRTYRYFKDHPEEAKKNVSLAEQFAQIKAERQARQAISG